MHHADTSREGVAPFSRRLTTLERLLAIEATELRSALDQASDFLGEALGADKIDVFLYEPTMASLVALGTSNTPMGRRQHALGLERMPVANGGRTIDVYQSGEPFWNEDVERDPGVLIGIREGLGVRSMIAVPLEVAGARRGVLEAVSAARRLLIGRPRMMLLPCRNVRECGTDQVGQLLYSHPTRWAWIEVAVSLTSTARKEERTWYIPLASNGPIILMKRTHHYS